MMAASTGPATTPNPADNGDHCHHSWSRRVLNRMTAINAVVKKNWPADADQNDRSRKRLRSRRGAGWVADRVTRSPKRATPTTATNTVVAEP